MLQSLTQGFSVLLKENNAIPAKFNVLAETAVRNDLCFLMQISDYNQTVKLDFKFIFYHVTVKGFCIWLHQRCTSKE